MRTVGVCPLLVIYCSVFQSYISCPFGIQMVGFVMASYGCATTVSALVTSRIAKYTGRYILFGLAACINMAIFVLLYIWVPEPGQERYVFAMAVVWGLGEGIWQTQSNGKCEPFLPVRYALISLFILILSCRKLLIIDTQSVNFQSK